MTPIAVLRFNLALRCWDAEDRLWKVDLLWIEVPFIEENGFPFLVMQMDGSTLFTSTYFIFPSLPPLFYPNLALMIFSTFFHLSFANLYCTKDCFPFQQHLHVDYDTRYPSTPIFVNRAGLVQAYPPNILHTATFQHRF